MYLYQFKKGTNCWIPSQATETDKKELNICSFQCSQQKKFIVVPFMKISFTC